MPVTDRLFAVVLALLPIAAAADGSAGDGAGWRELVEQSLTQVPFWIYLLGFAVLPAVGVPLTWFYLTIGAFVEGLAPALLLAWVCMGVNMALSYLVARAGAKPVHGLVRRSGRRVPQVQQGSEWRLILALRASPLPWLMQSWLLALGGARFLPYMLIGLPVQAMVGLGFIVLGESLLAGETLWALLGLFLILTMGLLLPRLRRRSAPVGHR